MSGPRHTDWMHAHYVGDRDEASLFLPEARKLLGFVVGEAQRNQLQTHQITRRLPNGVIIIAEIRGGIPRVTIVMPGREAEPRRDFRPDDFVVWARTDTSDGIDPSFPEQILRASRVETEAGDLLDVDWRTFFYESTTTGHDSFPGPKGTYSSMFPDGLVYNGNVDWRGPDGERLSWYGPSLRYWYDRWRQPSAQYGRYVFMLGARLLDIDQYCTDAEVDMDARLVLGACLRGGWLYVMQAKIDDVVSGAPFGRPWDTYVQPPYPVTNVRLRLMRYRVNTDNSLPQGQRYSVGVGSHEQLWTNLAGYTVNPWFFSPDGRKLTTVVMPAAPNVRRYWTGTAENFLYDLPSTSHQIATLEFLEDETIDVQTSMHGLNLLDGSGQPNECVVAVDYGDDNQPIELLFGYEAFAPPFDYVNTPLPGQTVPSKFNYIYVAPWCTYYFRVAETKVTLFASPDSTNFNEVWSRPQGIDIRQSAFVMWRTNRLPDWENFGQRIEFWCNGLLQQNEQYHTYEFINGGPPFHTGWQSLTTEGGQNQLSPLCMLMGVLMTGADVGDPPPPSSFPWAYYIDTGFGPVFDYQDPGDAFGLVVFYDASGTAAAAITNIADMCADDAPYNNRDDHLGFHAWTALAAYDGVLLYSGPKTSTHDYNTGADRGIAHYATHGVLPQLTGVDGANVRFHPLWMLGSLPRASLL